MLCRVGGAVHFSTLQCTANQQFAIQSTEFAIQSTELNYCALQLHIFLKLFSEVHCRGKKYSVIHWIKM